jgi:hypothetical protein
MNNYPLELAKSAAKAVSLHVSKDATRSALCGIRFETVPELPDLCELVATDGHTMFHVRMDYALLAIAFREIYGITLPERIEADFIVYLPKNGAKRVPGYYLEDYYPKWRCVIPQTFSHKKGGDFCNDLPIFAFEAMERYSKTRKCFGPSKQILLEPMAWDSCVGAALWEIPALEHLDYHVLIMPMRRMRN